MTDALLKTRPRATAFNGRSASIAEWKAVPELVPALREIELTIAADVISEMTGGRSTTNDPLALRCASRIDHFGVFADTRLPTAAIPSGAERTSSMMDGMAAELAAHPRGTWQVWRSPEGYSAWASDGFGNVKCWSGYAFGKKTERHPDHDPVAAHAMLLGAVIYEYRGGIRDAIVAHSVRTAAVPEGTAMRDVRVDGKLWTNLTYLGATDGTHKFAVSRRGQRATLTTRDEGAKRILGIPTAVPPHLVSDDGQDRLTSPREIRSEKAQAEFERIAAEHGITSVWGSKASFTRIHEERLERTVFGERDMPIGRIEVSFDGLDVVSAEYLPGAPVPTRF